KNQVIDHITSIIDQIPWYCVHSNFRRRLSEKLSPRILPNYRILMWSGKNSRNRQQRPSPPPYLRRQWSTRNGHERDEASQREGSQCVLGFQEADPGAVASARADKTRNGPAHRTGDSNLR